MRLKFFAVALLAGTMLSTPAKAGPLAFIPVAFSAIAGQALIGLGLSFAAAGAVLSTVTGLALSLALNFAANALFAPDAPTPQIQETQANFLQSDAPRFWARGNLRVGGPILFAEVKSGEPYILAAHADSELTADYGTYLQDKAVSIDGDNFVTTDDFIYNGNKYYQLYQRAGLGSQAAQPVLVNAFTEWTENHKGAGVCDTLMVLRNHEPQAQQRLRRFSGVVGGGLPNISRTGMWGRVYDPRQDSTQEGGDGLQRVDDRSTWGAFDGNCALLYADWLIDPEGFALSPSRINWENIIEQANFCDELVQDYYGGNVPRYRIALNVNKSSDSKIDVQNWIMQACDGMPWVDDKGRRGIFVGRFDPDPDLVFYDTDIGDLKSQSADDGETLKTHYFGSYTNPEYAYKTTQTAVYTSPDYVEGDEVETGEIQLPQLTGHNQAYRILSATVERQTEPDQLVFTSNIKAIKAKRRRFVRVVSNLDPKINGIYERAPINDPQNSLSFSVALIRCDNDRWNATEQQPPPPNITVTTDGDLENIAVEDMVVQAAQVQTSGGGSSAVLVAAYPPEDRNDIIVQIQYRDESASIWREMDTRASDGAGVSDIVSDGSNQQYRWRRITASSSASEWSAIQTVAVVADTTAPGDLSDTSATSPAAGNINYAWTAPAGNYYQTQIYRAPGSTSVFDDAISLPPQIGLPGAADTFSESGLTAETYNIWLEPVNGSGVPGTRVGPIAVTVA